MIWTSGDVRAEYQAPDALPSFKLAANPPDICVIVKADGIGAASEVKA